MVRNTELFTGTKILPRGDLLARTKEDMPFYVFEEEILRAGAVVTRGFTRVRWLDGRTSVWLGRQKRNGRGEGSSGLAFDGLVKLRTPGLGAMNRAHDVLPGAHSATLSGVAAEAPGTGCLESRALLAVSSHTHTASHMGG